MLQTTAPRHAGKMAHDGPVLTQVENVCVKAHGDKPGTITLPSKMKVEEIVFKHKSGGVTCAKSRALSNFGCANHLQGLVITKKDSKIVQMPLASQNIAGFSQGKKWDATTAHWYNIKGIGSSTPKMKWKFASPQVVNAGTYNVWFAEDLTGWTEGDNAGTACYDILVKSVPKVQTFGDGVTCMKGDFKTREVSGPHSIHATVTMPTTMPTANVRQWILNLGQFGAGADHWLWSTTNVHNHGDLQFGRWNGGQVKGVKEGNTHDKMSKAKSLTTTWDGKTYSLYLDGKLENKAAVVPALNIDVNNLRVGLQPPGWSGKETAFSGCVTKVEVWDKALTAVQACSWDGPHTPAYSPGCSLKCKPFTNLYAAQAACAGESSCGGVTHENHNGKWSWELRAGSTTRVSPYGETTYLKGACGPTLAREAAREAARVAKNEAARKAALARRPPNAPEPTLGCIATKHLIEDCTNKDFFIFKGGVNDGFVEPTYSPSEYNEDEHWKTVKVQDGNWKGACVAYVETGGGTCQKFCESQNMNCVNAMDDAHLQTSHLDQWLKTKSYGGTDCTLLPSGHKRKSSENNGCNQGWGTQICACN